MNTTTHEQRVRALCNRFGLAMFQRGAVWVICGKNGTDIRTTDLASVRESDVDRREMLRAPTRGRV